MTYTTQQLQGMEDAEINEAIAKKLGMVINSYCGDAVACGYEGLRSTFTDRDYCNKPNDIMPLAFERAIGIEKSPLRQEWIVRTCEVNMSNKKFRCYVDKNPLRAIACLLLMMED